MAAPARALGDVITKHDTARDYDFDDKLFRGGFGRSGIEDEQHKLKKYDEPVMEEVVALEEAKKEAQIAMTDLLSCKNREDAGEVHEDVIAKEHNVVECRIAVMNRFFQDEDDANLCNRVDVGRDHHLVKTSVTYKQYQNKNHDRSWEGDERPWEDLFATQSPVEWASEFEWYKIKPLLSPDTNDKQRAEVQNTLNRMLSDVIHAMPHNDSTDTLFKIQKYHIKTKPMDFTCFSQDGTILGAAIWQMPESTNKERLTYSATRKTHLEGEDVRVDVMIGCFDINYCDQWHNPLINRFVQRMVKAAGESAILESNKMMLAVHTTVKIAFKGMVHILNMAPYVTPDVCSVQNIFTVYDKGILNLTDMDIAEVIPTDFNLSFSEPQFYYCLGAHRNRRFNEQELNYIHTKAFEFKDGEIGVDALNTKRLPDHTELNLTGDNPKAKSTRISFDGWDILVSTYQNYREQWMETEYKTVITLFNYPPYGTKYRKIKDVDHSSATRWARPVPQQQPHPTAAGTEPTERERRQNFRAIPPDGTMKYFIWYSPDAQNKYVITVIDHTQDRRPTAEMIQKGMEINKRIYQDFSGGGLWLNDPPSLVHNIMENNNAGPHSKTVRETYLDGYREYITGIIKGLYDTDTGSFNGDTEYYLYCKDFTVWDDFKEDMPDDVAEQMIDGWKHYARERFDNDDVVDKRSIRETVAPPSNIPKLAYSPPAKGGNTKGLSAPPPHQHHQQIKNKSTIPLPGGRGVASHAKPPSSSSMENAVQRMKAHIASLETKIMEDARVAENRDHLLLEVLSRLDPSSKVTSAPPTNPSTRRHQSGLRP